MTEILIHDKDDLRPGDLLRVWPPDEPDRWAEGPICEMSVGRLIVGGLIIGWVSGEWITDRFDLTAHPARRTVPDLPTEAGSVILVTALDGKRLAEPMPAMLGNEGRWFVVGYDWYSADRITGWLPATVTEAGPEVTR